MTSTNHCSGACVSRDLCSRAGEGHVGTGRPRPPRSREGLADTFPSPRYRTGRKQEFFLFLAIGWKQMSRSCASLKKPGVWDEIVLKSLPHALEQTAERKRQRAWEACVGRETGATGGLCLAHVSRFDCPPLGGALCSVLGCLGVTEL